MTMTNKAMNVWAFFEELMDDGIIKVEHIHGLKYNEPDWMLVRSADDEDEHVMFSAVQIETMTIEQMLRQLSYWDVLDIEESDDENCLFGATPKSGVEFEVDFNWSEGGEDDSDLPMIWMI